MVSKFLINTRVIDRYWSHLVPSFVFGLFIIGSLISGPTWIVDQDPDYAYLFNGLNYTLSRTQLVHIHHPGTPLQIVIGLLIGGISLVLGPTESIAQSVVVHAEWYLAIINFSFVCCWYWLSVSMAQSVAARTSRSAAMLLQLLPLSSWVMLRNLLEVTPELMLMCIFTALTWMLTSIDPTSAVIISTSHGHRTRSWSLPAIELVTSIIGSLMLATKVTTAPLLFLPWLFTSNWKQKLRLPIWVGLGFIGWTWPIRMYYWEVWDWVQANLTHAEGHGTGRVGYPDLLIAFAHIKVMLSSHPALILMGLLAGLIALGWTIHFFTHQNWHWPRKLGQLFWASTLIQLASVITFARFPEPQYIVPCLSLIPIQLFALHQLELTKSKWQAGKKKLVFASATIMVIGSLFQFGQLNIKYWHQRQAKLTECADQLANHENGLEICRGRYNALNFGNWWSGSKRTKEIEDLAKR